MYCYIKIVTKVLPFTKAFATEFQRQSFKNKIRALMLRTSFIAMYKILDILGLTGL